MWIEAFIFAQQAANGGQKGSPIGMFFPLILIFGIFYFLLIRPQQKRDRQRRDMLAKISKGDRVVTNGGIFGTVVGLDEKVAVLKVSDNPVTKLEFLRGSISQVVTDESGDKGKETD